MISRAEECMQRQYMGEATAYDDIVHKINEGMPIGEVYAYCKEKSKFNWHRANFMQDYGIQEEDKRVYLTVFIILISCSMN